MSELATLRGVVRYAEQHPQAVAALRRLLGGPLSPHELSPEIEAALSALARVADHGGPLRFDGGVYLLTRAGREAVVLYDAIATQRERTLRRLSGASGGTAPAGSPAVPHEVKDEAAGGRGDRPEPAYHQHHDKEKDR